jgi:hypothetical protein
MRNIYIASFLLSFVMFSGCSKDFLKRYDKRIIGTWNITDVNRFGIGGSTDNIPFGDGTFTFNEGGTLTYVNSANATYQGSWDIVKKNIGDETVRSLQVTAIDFAAQQVLTEYYDDINFAGTDHFKANIISGFHTYVTHFRR